MELSDGLRGVFWELGEKIRNGRMEQPLFHTVVQCLYFKRDLIERSVKEGAISRESKVRREEFLDWLGRHPRFPFGTAQSEDSLQEKVRVLLLEEQLVLFALLENLWDSVNSGERSVLSNIAKAIGLSCAGEE